jgi:hypothetical protein
MLARKETQAAIETYNATLSNIIESLDVYQSSIVNCITVALHLPALQLKSIIE